MDFADVIKKEFKERVEKLVNSYQKTDDYLYNMEP